ncbi:MAG: YigZ family protein [Anaerolineales bacterium]|nr:YigZ family protein [Anaerolineales bacterium]
MTARQLIPAGRTRAEIRVVNSRFITTLTPAFSVEEARNFIEDIRTEFRDATHNVPVYIVGHGTSITAHSSDDGEPSGTAGRPALAVLQGSGLGDAAVVITRYFGGTKLGTGGLVRAYSDAVRAVLEISPLAEKIPTHTVLLSVAYNIYERLEILVAEHRGLVLEKDYAGDVTFTLRFPQSSLPAFERALQELTRGASAPMVIHSEENTIYPIAPQTN